MFRFAAWLLLGISLLAGCAQTSQTPSIEREGDQPVVGVIRLGGQAGNPALMRGVGRIRRVNADQGTIDLMLGGQVRTVRVAPDARFLDREGKTLAGGLRAKELSEGVEVTVTAERTGAGPVVRVIQLGAGAAGQPGAIPKVDTSGLAPLTELGTREYKGFPGGLYPGGKNERPAAHEAAGLALALRVRPLDAEGRAAPDGKIVLLSIGMSNTTQEYSAFKQLADRSPQKNPQLVLVDGAQGGMTAAVVQNPDDNGRGTQYWNTVDERLRSAGVTRTQVQVAWIKEADGGPRQGFPAYARTLQAELARIAQVLRARFPNLRLVYLSSRTYGGYASTPLNPEPYAYESGFSVKWLIEQQLKGDPELKFDPATGPAKAPWLSWGPYLWANGTTKRADGLAYEESDFGGDGTHPSGSGRQKVAEQLWKFFSTDSTTRGWFVRR
jgi:hypothetical protein